MTQVPIDRATLEQLVRMLEQCLDDAIQVQCDLEQGYSKSLALAQMVQVELSKEALTAGRAALAQQELPQKERPDFMAGYDAGMADAKRMAQQGEPTDDQLVKGVKAMRLFVTKNSVADFKLGYMAALAAAPAPQAQPAIKQSFTVVEQSAELDAGMAAQH